MPAMRVRLRRAKGDPIRPARRTELLEVGGHTLRWRLRAMALPSCSSPASAPTSECGLPSRPPGRIRADHVRPAGAGGSSPARLELGMAELADLTARLLDTLGQGRLDVLGYSWGGALAQELAHRHPDRVGRLVAVRHNLWTGRDARNPQAWPP